MFFFRSSLVDRARALPPDLGKHMLNTIDSVIPKTVDLKRDDVNVAPTAKLRKVSRASRIWYIYKREPCLARGLAGYMVVKYAMGAYLC